MKPKNTSTKEILDMIYIRADASTSIGIGHIMRCLSIADAASSKGIDVMFVLADNGAESIVRNRGYKSIILQSDYKKMEEEDWPEVKADCIIVDSYFVTFNYLLSLKHKIGEHGALVYIDDLAAFPYPVDILMNYNVYGPDLDYHSLYKNSDVIEPLFLLGINYVPLRSMFQYIPKKKQRQNVENILISTGGADSEHIALKIIQANPTKYTYHFLLGNMNQDKEEIKALASKKKNIQLHENVSNMCQLIEKMDIVVSAAGSTLYEICACGVPIITYIIADNQLLGAEAFDRLELAINLGDIRHIMNTGEIILSSIEKFAGDYEKRVTIGCSMQSMVDGFGADRIINSIISCCKLPISKS